MSVFKAQLCLPPFILNLWAKNKGNTESPPACHAQVPCHLPCCWVSLNCSLCKTWSYYIRPAACIPGGTPKVQGEFIKLHFLDLFPWVYDLGWRLKTFWGFASMENSPQSGLFALSFHVSVCIWAPVILWISLSVSFLICPPPKLDYCLNYRLVMAFII